MRPMQIACSPACAMAIVWAEEAKKQVHELRKRREASKPRAKWMREAQAAFNAWIRQRDKDLPCISCGRHHQGQWHAGHYLSTRARPELRFDERNVHKQCSACNRFLSGNATIYRVQLIAKVGRETVEWLEGPHEPRKYTIEDLRQIRDDYRYGMKGAK
jgi:Bacteriophage Lambda NinG protein